MTVARWGSLRLPVSGSGYFRIFPYWLTRSSLKRINEREQRSFVFYLHPWEIDAGQPRIKAGWKSRLRHYTNLSRCEQRLLRLLSEFPFAPMRDVLAGMHIDAPTRAAA
jgi:hypothetical protein